MPISDEKKELLQPTIQEMERLWQLVGLMDAKLDSLTKGHRRLDRQVAALQNAVVELIWDETNEARRVQIFDRLSGAGVAPGRDDAVPGDG